MIKPIKSSCGNNCGPQILHATIHLLNYYENLTIAKCKSLISDNSSKKVNKRPKSGLD